MKTDSIDYSDGNTELTAYVAYDDSITGKRPAQVAGNLRVDGDGLR
jgi:hypothetical protein